MTDIDERRNRIVIGVQSEPVLEAVRARLAGLDVPPDAVEALRFEAATAGPGTPESGECDPTIALVECPPDQPTGGSAKSLAETHRPVIGGYRVQYLDNLEFAAFNCTLGYNIAHRFVEGTLDPDRYFVTNSHCSDRFGFGAVQGLSMGQASFGERIGTEFADPPLFTNSADSRCPVGRKCRYSDAALFKYDDPALASHGEVAFPPVGSIWYTEIRTVGLLGDPIVGTTVHKIGQRTGHTVGTVQQVCVDIAVNDAKGIDTGRTLLCQARASYASDFGDSGSPVLEIFPDGTIVDRGVHWGGGGLFSVGSEYTRELQQGISGGLGSTISHGQ